jgi:hypothetical protein
MPESLAQEVSRLSALGYSGDFRAESKGLREVTSRHVYAPEELWIDELMRFEGPTDPDDHALLLALRSERDGVRGTNAVGFGVSMDALDAQMVRRLRDARDPKKAR